MANFPKFAKLKGEPIPKREEVTKSAIFKTFAISSSSQNAFHFDDQLGVSEEIKFLARVG